MKDFEIILKVNERDYPLKVSPNRTLLEVLREDLGLTGTKINCEAGECGVCTVILDGRAINSCTCLAVLADGIPITTIEGLAGPGGHGVRRGGRLRPAGNAAVRPNRAGVHYYAVRFTHRSGEAGRGPSATRPLRHDLPLPSNTRRPELPPLGRVRSYGRPEHC